MRQTEKINDRRVVADRRKFTYTAHSPERRSGTDRRAASRNMKTKVA